MDNNSNSKGTPAPLDEDPFKKDVDWFSFENKIRNLVVKLLEPVHKKQQEERLKMEILTNIGDTTKKRLDELEFLTCKTQQRACHYEELSGKIVALDNEMKTLDSKMDQQISALENNLKVHKEKLKATNNSIHSFDRRSETLADDFNSIRKKFLTTQDSFQLLFQKLHKDFSAKISDQQRSFEKVDEVKKNYERQVQFWQDDKKKIDLKVGSVLLELETLKHKSDASKQELQASYNKQCSELLREIDFLKIYTVKTDKEWALTNNYLDKILPLKTFTQLSQVLQQILVNDKEYNRLIQYQQLQYPLIEERIRDKECTLDKKEYSIPIIASYREEKKQPVVSKSSFSNQGEANRNRRSTLSGSNSLGGGLMFGHSRIDGGYRGSVQGTNILPFNTTAFLNKQSVNTSKELHDFDWQESSSNRLKQAQSHIGEGKASISRQQEFSYHNSGRNQTRQQSDQNRKDTVSFESQSQDDGGIDSSSPTHQNSPSYKEQVTQSQVSQSVPRISISNAEVQSTTKFEPKDSVKIRKQTSFISSKSKSSNKDSTTSPQTMATRQGLIAFLNDDAIKQSQTQILKGKGGWDLFDNKQVVTKSLQRQMNEAQSSLYPAQAMQKGNQPQTPDHQQEIEELDEEYQDANQSMIQHPVKSNANPKKQDQHTLENKNIQSSFCEKEKDEERSFEEEQEFQDYEDQQTASNQMELSQEQLFRLFQQYLDQEDSPFRELCQEVCKTLISGLKEEFTVKLDKQTELITNSHTRVLQDVQSLQQKYETNVKRTTQERRDCLLEVREVADAQKIVVSRLERLAIQVEEIVSKIAQINENLVIQHVLDLQELKDKDSVALYGYMAGDEHNSNNRSANKDCKSVISLNKNCLSCSGQTGFVKKAFKTACLAYSSGKVVYKGQAYNREDLLKHKLKLINTANMDLAQQIQIIKDQEQLQVRRAKSSSGQRAPNLTTTDFPKNRETPQLDYQSISSIKTTLQPKSESKNHNSKRLLHERTKSLIQANKDNLNSELQTINDSSYMTKGQTLSKPISTHDLKLMKARQTQRTLNISAMSVLLNSNRQPIQHQARKGQQNVQIQLQTQLNKAQMEQNGEPFDTLQSQSMSYLKRRRLQSGHNRSRSNFSTMKGIPSIDATQNNSFNVYS